MGLSKKKRILIKQQYGTVSAEELAKKLGLEEQDILQTAKELGLESAGISSYEQSFFPYVKTFLVPFLVLTTLTFIIYANALDGEFIYDDEVIAETEAVHAHTLSQIPTVLFSDSSVTMDRKVGMLSFAVNYYFSGLNPYGYHLINVIIHAVNGFLVYLLIRLTLRMPVISRCVSERAELTALAGAVLWVIHPVQTQAVTYIIQRFASMAALFFLLALLSYVHGRMRKGWICFVFYFAALVCGLMALGTKQTAAMLPVVILLYEVYFLKGIRLGLNKKSIAVVAIVVLIMGVLSYVFLSGESLARLMGKFQDRGLTPWENLLTEARVLVYYLSLLIFPHPSRLRLDYDIVVSRGFLNPATTIVSIAILGALSGVALWRARKNALLSFSILWFFINLVIESSILPLDLAYEHRLYVPSVAPLAYVAGSVINIRDRALKAVFSGILICVIVLFSYWTHERNYVWQDAVALWKDNARKSPNKARVLGNLGMAYIAARDFENALKETKKAIELDPDLMGAYLNLSAIYMDYYKDYDKAEQSLKELLKRYPDNTAAIHNMGIIKLRKKNFPEAIKLFRRILQDDPNSPLIYYNLSAAYINSEDYKNALSTLVKAVEKWPFHPELNGLLGIAYFELEDWQQAEATLQRAVSLGTKNPKVSEYLKSFSESGEP
jgi:Flp pilus assembly protein TadD/biotin operon repressor